MIEFGSKQLAKIMFQSTHDCISLWSYIIAKSSLLNQGLAMESICPRLFCITHLIACIMQDREKRAIKEILCQHALSDLETKWNDI